MGQEAGGDVKGIQVCIRVRPLNNREREEGHRNCVHFDEPTKQVVLSAVDRNTLLQLKGATARGYAFDKRYGIDQTSDVIYQDVVSDLINNVFKGYNATVLAYGQTGSGKTHTMSGGKGIHGLEEKGIIMSCVHQVFQLVSSIKRKMKPLESIEVVASALEIYNEDLRDLSLRDADWSGKGWDAGKGPKSNLQIKDRPTMGGRVSTYVEGLNELVVEDIDSLMDFIRTCENNRSTSSTKLNDRSSRSHAIFGIQINRVIAEVLEEVDENFKAKVRQEAVTSKLVLVDLAGSERVKRSGVSGKELKEASHINSGLLALGNVIVALSEDQQHIPYRSSKLTRLLSDSLGGNSQTTLITCIGPSEADFEETNNTLKYANRACRIKNTPLPNKYVMLEEDLLPAIPMQDGAVNMVAMSQLLDDHEKQKELKEKREHDRAERERKVREAMQSAKDQQMKITGIQRLRAQEYARKLKERQAQGKTSFRSDESIHQFDPTYQKQQPGRVSFVKQVSQGSKHPAGSGIKAGTGGVGGVGGQAPSAEPSAGDTFDFDEWMQAQNDAGGLEQGEVEVDGEGGEAGERALERVEEGTGEEDVDVEDEVGDSGVDLGENGDGEGTERIIDIREKFGLDEDEVSKPLTTIESEGVQTEATSLASPSIAADSSTPISEPADSAIESSEVASTATKVDAAVGSGSLVTPHAQQALTSDASNGQPAVPTVPAPHGRAQRRSSSRRVYKPRLLARFKVNQFDTISVFKATSKEDFRDVVKLLPDNTPLPASDKMTYLIARLEISPKWDINERLEMFCQYRVPMTEAVGPAVGCLMATFGTNMISSCIFDFEDPEELDDFSVEERIELWGLQIPHNSVRPTLAEDPNMQNEDSAADAAEAQKNNVIQWTSIDRLNMSVGLLYALCNHAEECDVRCGFCVPRPQLLRRWQQAGVRMRQVHGGLKLIYPKLAHDYDYYKSSTVAYFLVEDVQEGLERVLSLMPPFDKINT